MSNPAQAPAVERDLLLREVNHRLGNSLQLISSLLGTQESASTTEEARMALQQARQRVMAIAQLHRQLYTSNDVASVSLNEYLGTMVGALRRSSGDRIAVALTLPEEPIDVIPDHALAIGVTITELVLNARKHAHPDGEGQVRIELRADHLEWMSVIVEDDGLGRDGLEDAANRGLGQTIVPAMASKLDAEWDYDRDYPGTRATLRIWRSATAKVTATPESDSADRPLEPIRGGTIARAGASRAYPCPLTPALAKVAMSRWQASAALMTPVASAAPEPSPSRMPRSSSGFLPSRTRTSA